MTSNRSPSPFSSRNCRNSEAYSTTRRSFNGNPFAKPTPLINPKTSNPSTPSNTPTATDHTKRNSITRKSIGSLFQDGKENHKDAIQSRAKISSRNFMSPTISAASKFTPSPRKKILGEKNDVALPRASIKFLDKHYDSNSDALPLVQTIKTNDGLNGSGIVDQKETVVENHSVNEVNLSAVNFGDSDLCCSPMKSTVVDTDSDSRLPPYDPDKNFLSPRPRFLRYKPNPRVELILSKEGDDDYEDKVIVSEISSLTGAELGDDSVHESSHDLCQMVLEEKPIDLKVEKLLKPRVFRRSKAVWFVFVLFLAACFSLSFTDDPPVDLPIYEDVGFLEVYYGSLRFATSAKESFDDIVEVVKKWSVDLVSYLSHWKSGFIPTDKIQFFNLTTSSIQEDFKFNTHVGADYIQEIKESEEETERMEEEEEEEEDWEETEVDHESEVEDEVVTEESIHEVKTEEPILEQIHELVVEEPIHEAQSEMLEDAYEIEPNFAHSNGESEASSSLWTEPIAPICVMVVMAVSTLFYMNQKKSNASKSVTISVDNDNARSESCSSEKNTSVHSYKKKTSSKKRESLSSSTSDLSMGSDSFGSFTTFERIAIKHKDEETLTPIRRSSRLLKNQTISS